LKNKTEKKDKKNARSLQLLGMLVLLALVLVALLNWPEGPTFMTQGYQGGRPVTPLQGALNGWVDHENAKLAPGLRKYQGHGQPDADASFPSYLRKTVWSQDKAAAGLHGLPIFLPATQGIPWRFLDFSPVPGKGGFFLERLERRAAQYDTRILVLHGSKIVRDLVTCAPEAGTVVQPDGSVLILTMASGCGPSFSALVDIALPDGQLKSGVQLGAWEGSVWLVDMNGDGLLDYVCHGRQDHPADLKQSLASMDGYDEHKFPLYTVTVRLNRGDHFEEAGQWWSGDEEW
jgi:hypothetical protein